MSKLVKFFAVAALVGGAFAMTPSPAAAYHGHGGHGHGGYGHWHGGYGHGGWGHGFGWGLGWGLGWGYPYYGPSYYYAEPACGWAQVRVWRHGHWAWRRAWRCW